VLYILAELDFASCESFYFLHITRDASVDWTLDILPQSMDQRGRARWNYTSREFTRTSHDGELL